MAHAFAVGQFDMAVTWKMWRFVKCRRKRVVVEELMADLKQYI
jgi:hypothetical protein